jgi:hypothetical protein
MFFDRIKKKKKIKKIAEDLTEEQKSPFDPLGMYTGAPEDGQKPVQDADDL